MDESAQGSITFDQVKRRIKRNFLIFVLPPLVLLAFLSLANQSGKVFLLDEEGESFYELTFFLICLVFGAAVPLFYRNSFAGKSKEGRIVELSRYLSFQRNMALLAMVSTVALCGEYLVEGGTTYLYGSVLATLYGIFAVFPEKKRIKKELYEWGFHGQLKDGDDQGQEENSR